MVFSFREEQQQNPEITYNLNFKANSNGDSNNSNSPQVSENDAAEQIQYSPGQQESGEKNSIQQSQKKMKKGFNCL